MPGFFWLVHGIHGQRGCAAARAGTVRVPYSVRVAVDAVGKRTPCRRHAVCENKRHAGDEYQDINFNTRTTTIEPRRSKSVTAVCQGMGRVWQAEGHGALFGVRGSWHFRGYGGHRARSAHSNGEA
jgi:hypothetical protein